MSSSTRGTDTAEAKRIADALREAEKADLDSLRRLIPGLVEGTSLIDIGPKNSGQTLLMDVPKGALEKTIRSLETLGFSGDYLEGITSSQTEKQRGDFGLSGHRCQIVDVTLDEYHRYGYTKAVVSPGDTHQVAIGNPVEKSTIEKLVNEAKGEHVRLELDQNVIFALVKPEEFLQQRDERRLEKAGYTRFAPRGEEIAFIAREGTRPSLSYLQRQHELLLSKQIS